MSWNVAYWKPAYFKSYGNRRRQWAFLGALTPDIALLQECRPSDLTNHAPSWLADEYVILGEIPSGWGACSAVLARKTLHPRFVPPEDTDGLSVTASRWVRYLSAQIARVEIEGASDAVTRVVCVHARVNEVTDDDAMTPAEHETVKRVGCDCAWNNDLVVAALRDWVGQRYVVGGDWNTARAFDVQYDDPHECGRQFFDRIQALGWAETLRARHPEEVQTYLDPKSHGYQLDHLFTDPHTHGRLVSCEVVRGAAIDEMSDHAPILADYALASTPRSRAHASRSVDDAHSPTYDPIGTGKPALEDAVTASAQETPHDSSNPTVAIAKWECTLCMMVGEQEALRADGQWVGGPVDMLSVIGYERWELAHSALIAWLLDPSKMHGLGSRFLEHLLAKCFPDETFDLLGSATVSRETPLGAGIADILVRSPDHTIAIENKVDADEHDGQCDTYYNALQGDPGARFVFLTPTGRVPWSATGEAALAFRSLSYPQLADALRCALKESVDDPPAAGRSTAEQYLLTLDEVIP